MVRKGWLVDPSDFVGDVVLNLVCPPGVDVARYLNYHEDPGGLSLALGRDSIAYVQRVAIPLPATFDADWARNAISALTDASDALIPPAGKLARFRRPSSLQAAKARELDAALADRLPVNLREQLASAAGFGEGNDPAWWARRSSALAGLVLDTAEVLAALDEAELRQV